MLQTQTVMTKVFSACVEWLDDWSTDVPPFLDEYDLVSWLEEEGIESFELFLTTAFRKSKTRQDAIELLRALVWEWYLSKRASHLAELDKQNTAAVVPRLLGAPQTAQKTPAWYAEARDLLTGHEFAAIVYGTDAAFDRAVAKKCAPPMDLTLLQDAEHTQESRTVYCSPLTPFQWGWRFEPIIRSLFEIEVAGGRVNDTLGRVRHPTLPRLAASPDGLIVDGPKAGRLVEIKAPITRLLTRVIPQDYYCQMQLQAEVADVEAVEYVEVRFEILAESMESMEPREGVPNWMGVVLVIAPSATSEPETWTYAYSPLQPCSDTGFTACQTWLPDDFPSEGVVVERSIWRIRDWWTTTVPRNRRWWAEVGQPAYEDFWATVDEARESGKYVSRCLLLDDDEEVVEQKD